MSGTDERICIGDISTHKVKSGQLWRHFLDHTNTVKVVEVKSLRNITVELSYLTFGSERNEKCDIHKDVNPYFFLHDYELVTE